MSTINRKRTFSEMENDDNDDNDGIANSNKNEIKSEPQNDTETTSIDEINQFHQIEYRYNNEQFPLSLITEIAFLVFKIDKNETNKLEYDIIEYLCKIGICIPCIYRICNKFECISQKTNCNDLILSLIKMEQKTKSKHCFICNDIYLKLYESLKNDKLLSMSAINEYEYKSYYLTIKIPPILTIRDFYIIHHLHHQIKQSLKIISFPSNDNDDSHIDLIHFMIQNLSKPLLLFNNNNNNNNNNNINTTKNQFGYTHGEQVDIYGINIILSFYHNAILNHLKNTSSDLNNLANSDKTKTIKTKQAKKRDKFKKWKHRKNKKNKQNNNNNNDNAQNDDNCLEYQFLKKYVNKQWKQKHHTLNSLKLFLMDLESFQIIVELCDDIQKHSFLTLPLLPWITIKKEEEEEEKMDKIDVKIDVNRSKTIYIAGEYNKYSREVSQTPFPFAKTSIITLIVEQMRKWNINNNDNNGEEPKRNDNNNNNNNNNMDIDTDIHDKSKIVNPHSNEYGWIDISHNISSNNTFCCDKVIFHSAGREDLNVRMLGNGRPLLLQIMNPRKTISLSTTNQLKLFQTFCNKNVDGMIALKNLRIVDNKYQEWMKSIENTKNKSYRCLCWISKLIKNQNELNNIWLLNDIKYPLLLKQWTPIRVLHRRSLTERVKKIYDIKLKWISNHWIEVDIVSEAGTYIKEFCHGDRGRTYPNLASLLKCNNANIIQLDVIAVLT